MCKVVVETLKNDLEIEVPGIKIMRLRKVVLEWVLESLKQHILELEILAMRFC